MTQIIQVSRYSQLKDIRREINKDGFGLNIKDGKQFNKTQFIFGIYNQQMDQLVSIMYVHICSNTNLATLAFSFTLKNHREKGYASRLRKHAICFCKDMRCYKIISVPFENALSISGLEKSGFIKKGQYYELYL